MPLQTGGLHHLAIRVTDLARAKRFYTDTLGFQFVLEAPGLVLVNAHGTFLGLRGDAPETSSQDHFDPFRVGLDHLALAVANAEVVAELQDQLDRAGVRNNGVECDSLVGAKYVAFYDPDGVAWELYAMPSET